MPVELLLLLLAWVATVSLLVVLPWAVIRLSVVVLEADVSTPGDDHEHGQPHQPPDAPAGLPRKVDEPVEPDDAVSPLTTPDADADR
ncbi:hypothetical protein [Haladaptatus sp. NG-SE-30]